MEDLKRKDIEKKFEDFSEKFTYALGLKDDFDDLCRLVRYCINTEDINLIHRAIRALSIAHNNITLSPNFCSEDREVYLDMVDAMYTYYMQIASRFFE